MSFCVGGSITRVQRFGKRILQQQIRTKFNIYCGETALDLTI